MKKEKKGRKKKANEAELVYPHLGLARPKAEKKAIRRQRKKVSTNCSVVPARDGNPPHRSTPGKNTIFSFFMHSTC
jgi:hypothetical protein